MTRFETRAAAVATAVLILAASAPPVLGQIEVTRDVPCCEIESSQVIWAGSRSQMTLDELAVYCGPILWFSPDEPLLKHVKEPADIDNPMAFPFEEPADGPVVYYRVRTIIRKGSEVVFHRDPQDLGQSTVELDKITAMELDYFFYYPYEEGLGGHVHDVESVEMKLAVFRQPDCTECRYGIAIARVNAKAHGILWYDNTLDVDEYTRFPMVILVEEGKHASCTDKNGDGYFTPGYDVNQRVNDAWGVRDVMRTGTLFSGGFQSWFAKVRVPGDRVFPPLPADSRAREEYTEDGEYASGYAKYSVRPFPTLEAAEAHDDPTILRFVDKGHHDWPELEDDTAVKDLVKWVDEEGFAKSLSIAYRYDGGSSGISFVFPLFVLRNFNDPISGGWLVNRIYFKDKKLRDFGWNVLYTTSASRWIDGYLSAGLEVDKEDLPDGGIAKNTDFTTETGFKFRGNVSHSPLKFLGALTDFWGLRFGIRYKGFKEFNEIGYVFEIGAGTF